jgi:branched-chain amino acid transport system permease protein
MTSTTPMPTSLRTRRLPAVRLGATGAVLLALALIPVLGGTGRGDSYLVVYLYFVFFWVTQSVSWNIFSGYAGYFSFAQGAFYGAGVYTTVLLVEHLNLSILIIMPIGAIVAGVTALLTGLIVFGLRSLSGEIFALFTLSLGLGFGVLANNVDAIDGGRGRVLGEVDYPRWLGSVNQMLYVLGLILAVTTIVCARVIQYSRMGYGLAAIRDDEHVGGTLGVPTLRYKLMAFAIGAALAGASGSLHAVLINFVTPDAAFGQQVPFYVIVMSVIGGRRHWLGPVLGATLIYTTNDRLTNLGVVEVNQLLVGLLLIVVVVALRAGIVAQLFRRARGTALVAAATALVFGVSGLSSDLITTFTWGMLAGLALLLLPDPVYRLVSGRRALPWGPRTRGGDKDKPASSRPRPVSRGVL